MEFPGFAAAAETRRNPVEHGIIQFSDEEVGRLSDFDDDFVDTADEAEGSCDFAGVGVQRMPISFLRLLALDC